MKWMSILCSESHHYREFRTHKAVKIEGDIQSPLEFFKLTTVFKYFPNSVNDWLFHKLSSESSAMTKMTDCNTDHSLQPQRLLELGGPSWQMGKTRIPPWGRMNTHPSSYLHWRFGIVVVVEEGRQALNNGIGTGHLLGTSCSGDWWFAHDFSVSRGARGIFGLSPWIIHWI